MAFKNNGLFHERKVLISVYIAKGVGKGSETHKQHSLTFISQVVARDLKGNTFVFEVEPTLQETEGGKLCKDKLHKTNCDIGVTFPTPRDEPEAPSRALQWHGGGWVGGEKEEESTHVDFIES